MPPFLVQRIFDNYILVRWALDRKSKNEVTNIRWVRLPPLIVAQSWPWGSQIASKKTPSNSLIRSYFFPFTYFILHLSCLGVIYFLLKKSFQRWQYLPVFSNMAVFTFFSVWILVVRFVSPSPCTKISKQVLFLLSS